MPERCPTCGSSNPWFTQCLDPEVIDDYPRQPRGCSDPFHASPLIDPNYPPTEVRGPPSASGSASKPMTDQNALANRAEAAEAEVARLNERIIEINEHNMMEACDECNERLEASEARVAELEAALGGAREVNVQVGVERDRAQARVEQLEAALREIANRTFNPAQHHLAIQHIRYIYDVVRAALGPLETNRERR